MGPPFKRPNTQIKIQAPTETVFVKLPRLIKITFPEAYKSINNMERRLPNALCA